MTRLNTATGETTPHPTDTYFVFFSLDNMPSPNSSKDFVFSKFTHGRILHPGSITGFPSSLPEGLRLITVAMGSGYHFAVINCKKVVAKGTRLGPFTGDHVTTSEVFEGQDNAQMWEVKNVNTPTLLRFLLQYYSYNPPSPLPHSPTISLTALPSPSPTVLLFLLLVYH